jgi:heptosyltransferase III
VKAAIFAHGGLGDGIISMILSHNFHQNGWEVDTFHNGMSQLQGWFSHLPIKPYPEIDQIASLIDTYDRLIIFHNDTNPFTLKLTEEGKKNDPEKVKVFYAIPSTGVIHKPYYSDCLVDPKKPIADNLKQFCDLLELQKTTKKNGIIPPVHLTYRKYSKRVVMHVSSSRPGKNWPIEKYIAVAKALKKQGYDPYVIAGGAEERKEYLFLEKEKIPVPLFRTLHDVASFIYESGFFIGNDSGLGHLASSLGIPTLTISRRKKVAKFWKPSWAVGKVVTPPSWIVNISGFRLRDRKWKYFISAGRVMRAFFSLVKDYSNK